MNIYRNLFGFILTITIISLHFSFAESLEQPHEELPFQGEFLEEVSSDTPCIIEDMFGCWMDLEDVENPEDCKFKFHEAENPEQILCLNSKDTVNFNKNLDAL
ncbi:MAG: hypothetical protein OXK80_06740 [Bdellovibrionales bacterium]|nr:hypothetical protein [Bdellovibrionales bacterium]